MWFKKKNRLDNSTDATQASGHDKSEITKSDVVVAPGNLGSSSTSTSPSKVVAALTAGTNSASLATPQIVMPEISAIEKRFGKLRSALGPGTEVQGRLSFDSAISLDGVLKGTIRSTSLIVVSKLAKVETDSLVAKALIIEGYVSGSDITVSERLEVLAGGKFCGTVTTPILVVADGGIFDGVCKMPGSAASKTSSAVVHHGAGEDSRSRDQGNQDGQVSNNSQPIDGVKRVANGGFTGMHSSANDENKAPKKKLSMDELLGK